MESKHESTKIICLIVAFLLVGCSQNRGEVSEEVSPSRHEVVFENGDIICRLGTGFFSKHFRDRASKEKIYSHIGVVETTVDSTYVIHVEASELTGIGFVKREAIEMFLDGVPTWGVYRANFTDSIKEQIAIRAKTYFDKHTSFDLDFNADNDREVYCTELVALAINQAVDSAHIKPTLLMGEKIGYALDDIYMREGIEKVY